MLIFLSRDYFLICTLIITFLPAYFNQSGTKYNIPEYPGIKYCFSSMDILAGGSRYSNLYTLKTELDKNCTHVYGNIVINGITKEDNGVDPDLSFLSSITEITGSLKIINSNVDIIPLTKLSIIRGNSKVNRLDLSEYLRKALEITYDRKTDTIFDLRNLRSIISGNVKLSPEICSQLANVDWNELLESSHEQFVNGNCSTPKFKCSPKCHSKNGIIHCWGPSEFQCQKYSKCEKRMCSNRCFVTKNGDEECCNSQCVGGCTSSSPDACVACARVFDRGKCQSECPPKKITNRETGFAGNNVNFRPSFVNICVQKCPDNLVEQEGECRSHCTIGNYEIKNNECVPCLKYCEQICTMENVFSENEIRRNLISLDSRKLKKLRNCTTFKGSILLDRESFITDADMPFPVTNASDLWNLINLRNISGSILIDLKYAPFKLNNLSFLGQLQVIGGNSPDIPASLGILNTNIEFLGLRSLVSIGMKGHTTKWISIRNNSNLCYFDYSQFMKVLDIGEVVMYDGSSNSSQCVAEGKVCSKQCAAKLGCWGPGPTYCHACSKKKLGIICADSCTSSPGYFEYKESVTSNICRKCHEQCTLTCSGERSNECIGGCKNYMENGHCVANCSRTHFINMSTRICEQCHPECHQRNFTRLNICTGPSSKPGFGGCNKCRAILFGNNQGLQRCTNSPMQFGYFSENLSNIKSLMFSQYTEESSDLIVIYRPCNPLCSRCTFFTDQRIKDPHQRRDWNGCLRCKGYWFRETCVAKCSSNETFLAHDLSNTSKGICHSCHPHCHGCSMAGNDNCTKCRMFRIYNSFNTSNFLCADSCPSNYKEKEFNSKLNETICLNVLLSKLELLLAIIATAIVLILFVSLVVILRFWYQNNEKRRSKKVTDHFSNVNESDCNNFKPPNITKLLLIKMANLDFDRYGANLGKGAFGVVYFGQWKPEESDFDDNTSMNSCKDKKVDVAIKIVNQSCSVNEFMDEVKIMASVRHKHCLRLIGVCFTERSYLLISSFIPLGSMDKYLPKHKDQLTGYILLLWAEQIANAMLYLERNHIIHRDLATRNVLINNESHVQITDFGLAQVIESDQQVRISSGIVPVRWLAIESIKDGIYSHKTDVWSYAVTLWEIFTFAKTPYDTIKAHEIRDEIIKGTRLCQPEICSLEIYILMLKCWSVEPNERPTFEYVWEEFKMFCNNPKTYLSYPNNETRSSSNIDNSYLQIVKTRNDDLYGSSRRSSVDIQAVSSLNGSVKRDDCLSYLRIPTKISKILTERPTRNKFYQPALDSYGLLLENMNSHTGEFSDRVNETQFSNSPFSLQKGRDSSPMNMYESNATEYMEPERIRHISN